MRKLYYGDNLQVLRNSIKDETVDLVYLDPPFNSAANYNILFKSPTGDGSTAQIEAFEDTWQWGTESEILLEQMKFIHGELAQFLHFLVDALGRNAMSAYLVMMAARLVELHRVLKPTGSLYLHCDPTASHYLKVILDRIFGNENYRNEIIWQRTNVHNDSKTWSKVSDTIFFYTKSNQFTWNPLYAPHTEAYLKSKYRYCEPDGRIYRLDNMTSPAPRPNMMYEWKGHASPPNGWRYSPETMAKLDAEGRLWYPDSKSKRPQLKRYLDQSAGTIFGSVWTDIAPLNSMAKERLGYPTQKPVALMERIVQASSNPGDIVLDPFCGCGTAVHAAEKLGRSWIGIDITHLAISLIENRLLCAFPGIAFEVVGTPTDLDGAKDLADRDKYQFQWWACSLVNAQPYGGKKKGADGGIDGQIFFNDYQKGKSTLEKIIVSVKGGNNVSLTMLKDLIATVSGNKAAMGFFVTLTPPTKPMLKEAAAVGFYRAGNGQQYPKIQILTIEGLLGGTERPQYFDMRLGDLTYKKAQRESIAIGEQQELSL
ncbi:MAG: site-specific DNA-methyltransferase [Leptolyngbyaceae cyanobacterium SM1_3_5]|nr:site-specific DNA-methyltransferase [Leptolyngbyaceae cyanobacterium SM1_3_5]